MLAGGRASPTRNRDAETEETTVLARERGAEAGLGHPRGHRLRARRSRRRSRAARSATTRRPPSRASCRSASGSSGWSTPGPSPRRACSPTGTPRASAPTASSPALALIAGRKVCLMANDPTVKAGSWGPKTVEKILRIQERALTLELPMIYLVDSAGARITDQVQMFPGRRGAGRIFYNEVKLSGRVPQVCLLFGPSRRRRRLHPGLLRRRDHARGQRLDVPGLAADGRDGDRREGHAWRRWAGRRCTPASRAAGTSWSRPTRRRSSSPSATSRTCRPTGASAPPAAPPGRAGGRPGDLADRARRREDLVRHQGADRRR